MKTKFLLIPLVLLVVLVVGCATAPVNVVQVEAENKAKPERETKTPEEQAPKDLVVEAELNTIATDAVKSMAEEMVLVAEGVFSRDCEKSRIIASDVIEEPVAEGRMWVEKWTVNRCGTIVKYRMRFIPKSDDSDTDVIITRSNEPTYLIEESRKLN